MTDIEAPARLAMEDVHRKRAAHAEVIASKWKSGGADPELVRDDLPAPIRRGTF